MHSAREEEGLIEGPLSALVHLRDGSALVLWMCLVSREGDEEGQEEASMICRTGPEVASPPMPGSGFEGQFGPTALKEKEANL